MKLAVKAQESKAALSQTVNGCPLIYLDDTELVIGLRVGMVRITTEAEKGVNFVLLYCGLGMIRQEEDIMRGGSRRL